MAPVAMALADPPAEAPAMEAAKAAVAPAAVEAKAVPPPAAVEAAASRSTAEADALAALALPAPAQPDVAPSAEPLRSRETPSP